MFVAGDLKLVEKPQPIVMSPHDFTNIKASVKVASTENGIIFGNIGAFFKRYLSFIWVRSLDDQLLTEAWQKQIDDDDDDDRFI